MEAVVLFIGGSEIFIILLIVLLLFGADKIPELARGLGKGMSEFKKATDDIKREFVDNDDVRDLAKKVKDSRKIIENNDVVKKIEKDIKDIGNDITKNVE